MSITLTFKRYLRPVLVPAFGTCLVGYFAFHAIQGEHGLIARSHLRVEVAEAEAVLADLKRQRGHLEHRADLLNPEHMDIDMLEERLRIVLNYTHRDEVVFFTGETPRGTP